MSNISKGTIKVNSFVKEVLVSSEGLLKEEANTRLTQLNNQINQVKHEIYSAVYSDYSNFGKDDFQPVTILEEKAQALLKEMKSLSSLIEKEVQPQVCKSFSEFGELSSRLDESHYIINILTVLVDCHNLIENLDTQMKNQQFSLASSSIKLFEEKLDAMPEIVGKDTEPLKILDILIDSKEHTKRILVDKIYECFNETVIWKIPKMDKKKDNVKPIKQAYLTIGTSDHKIEIFNDTINALYYLDLLKNKLETFAYNLFNFFLSPIVIRDNIEIQVTPSSQHLEFSVKYGSKSKKDPTLVFEQILSIISPLNRVLPKNFTFGDEKLNLMSIICQFISNDFLKLLKSECLAHSIPTTTEDLKDYSKTVQKTNEFEANLIELNFLSSDNNELSDFIKNVSTLFANKKCQEILETARNLMTSDIHNIIPISDSKLQNENIFSKDNVKNDIRCQEFSGKLSTKTFQLPSCMISQSTHDLMLLAYKTMHEATKSNASSATQLFYSVRNVFDLFCCVVPVYHKESLKNLPQLSAIHHNNCMYIAHHLQTFGHQFNAKLPKPLSLGFATLVDMVSKFRRLGTQCFLSQMIVQRNQILEYLEESKGFQDVSEDDNFIVCERVIKKCLHQILHLTNLWKNVLPRNVFLKSIGTLVNTLLQKVISDILVLRDISAKDATQLHCLLVKITDKTPEFYEPVCDSQATLSVTVSNYVFKWIKAQEVLFVLNANLQAIGDRWADGAGPLSVALTANEVKSLVRAIFQNTDQRSALLSSINS